MTQRERFADYIRQLRMPFQKLCRLRFLQPDGATAFALDNHPESPWKGAFLADGQISMNWQNGRRTSAVVKLSNIDGAFDYNLNRVWFGSEIALDEGLLLSDGSEFYLQQGVFLPEEPVEMVRPAERTAEYTLVDKTAMLDGSLGGNLEGTYRAPEGTNLFDEIAALLSEDRGNGQPVDRIRPVFTDYFNGRTQILPTGETAYMELTPHTVTIETGGTKWDVITGLTALVNGWVGYDETGALRVDPSQDDILDTEKPVLWEFSLDDAQILGLAYTVKNTDVYNDYICVGEQSDDYDQPGARAEIYDPKSSVNILQIGRKTIRYSHPGFYTETQCRDYAEWMVKRSAVLQRAVSIECSQMFHIRGNELVTVVRTDKPGSPVERHLVQGFTRPLASNGAMTITATSVHDFPVATVSIWNDDI